METLLIQSTDSAEVYFKTCTLVRADGIQKRKGGGALFIGDTIPLTVTNSTPYESGICELVNCRLKSKIQELLIGLFYYSTNCGSE